MVSQRVDLRPGNTRPTGIKTLDWSKKRNWVDKAGGLPPYIERIAKHFVAQGLPRKVAIPRAIGIVRNVARTGRPAPGQPKWGKDVRAQAVAALAQWNRMKAQS